jgi:hypothetical protein
MVAAPGLATSRSVVVAGATLAFVTARNSHRWCQSGSSRAKAMVPAPASRSRYFLSRDVKRGKPADVG